MQVPWKKVASWHCTACGRCCYEYKINLRLYEYLKLKATGFVEEKFGKFYIKKIDGKCPFQVQNLCILQKNKPFACKIYPFRIFRKGKEEALFEFNGEEFYVYVDVFCKNVLLKNDLKASKLMIPLVEEAVKLYAGEISTPKNLTANLESLKLQQHHLRRVKV
ncbi:MAG: YkgJ family cysteine cluster protein [Archaeoglobaceae archaeon]|nr:YkgJ family cysteine cluster protein [Archaeoglobaceae archaeon]MCX8152262.1 YkgJ family cysteine cluster protein [Archaeoglobaceae archaeon]MDW8013940.1 YkgJ family cysteine cluster protein [Archaeoglobaceae archaeon]